MQAVFNILSLLTFFGLAIAVFIAIRRGMGVHSQAIMCERGAQGIIDYKKVCVSPCRWLFGEMFRFTSTY
jgi:hypothetical protein